MGAAAQQARNKDFVIVPLLFQSLKKPRESEFLFLKKYAK